VSPFCHAWRVQTADSGGAQLAFKAHGSLPGGGLDRFDARARMQLFNNSCIIK
jgi:hypothetical protein